MPRKLYGDETGLAWVTPPPIGRGPNAPRQYAPLPPVEWMPPAEMLRLNGVKRLCIDVETRDPDLRERGPGSHRDAYIVGLALGTDDGRRAYYPVRHEGGGNLDEASVRRYAQEVLGEFTGEIVGAHLLYDLEMLSTWDVSFKAVRGFHDVLLAEPLIDEWRFGGYSLDAVAGYELGESKKQTVLDKAAAHYGWHDEAAVKGNLWQLHSSYVGDYGEGDADLPLRILEKQLPMLASQGLMEVYDLERELIPMLLAMRLRGVKVNVARAEKAQARLIEERDQCLAQARHIAGTQHVELMAPESFARALSERGLQFPVTCKTGKPSITKGWLEANEGDALVDAIQAGRRVEKVINTFIGGILEHQVKGRIYAQFPQLKSENGGTIARFSSKQPNLQNQPARDEELGPLTRSIFEAEEGEEWERQDESQIEYRLLVHFASSAKDKQGRPLAGADDARRAYVENPATDFHEFADNLMPSLRARYPEVKTRRKYVKNLNFCRVYMGGDDKLAATAKCTLAEAKSFSQTYNRELPFVRQIGLLAMERANERGYITTLLGRRQRFTLWEKGGTYNSGTKQERKDRMLPYDEAKKAYGANIKPAFTHAALNRALQGSAADVLKKAMRDTWKAGICDVLGALLITVHDESNYSVPRTKEGQEAAAEARYIMENCVKLNVPLRVDYERGPNWGECK